MNKDIYSNILQSPAVNGDNVIFIGDFGLGGLAIDLPTDDADSAIESGVYKTKATTLNTPDDVTDPTDSVIFSMPVSAQIQQQMFFDKAGESVFNRAQVAGVWLPWRRFSFTGDDISYGNVSITNRATFINPSDITITGYVEQVDSLDENILRLSATALNEETTIDLYGDASSTQIKTIVITAGGTVVTIDSDGIKSTKMGGTPEHLVSKQYIDELIILPFQDSAYISGSFSLPVGMEWTDFREIKIWGYPADHNPLIVGPAAIAPKELIAQYPDSFIVRTQTGESEFAEITATSVNTFIISRVGNDGIVMVTGLVDYDALDKIP